MRTIVSMARHSRAGRLLARRIGVADPLASAAVKFAPPPAQSGREGEREVVSVSLSATPTAKVISMLVFIALNSIMVSNVRSLLGADGTSFDANQAFRS